MFVYPRWEINAAVWWQYLFPLAVLGLLGILWSLRRWSRAPLAGVLIYIFLLLPSLGFLNIYFFIYSFVADHWQYLACLGIITPCASGIVLLAGRLKRWQALLEPATMLLLGGVLFVLTWQQSRMYTDIETLYRTTIARNPACWMAQVNLGNILYQANRIPEAMDLFNQAMRIKPAVAYYSVGNALVLKGRTSEAIDQYKQALQIDPDYAEAHHNLGSALFLTGRTPEAIEHYEQALRIDPAFAEAHNNLGNALVQTGRAPEAIDHYKEALRITPNSADAHNNLAAALAQMGRISEAIEQLKAALRIKPYDTDTRNNLTKLEELQKTLRQKSIRLVRSAVKRNWHHRFAPKATILPGCLEAHANSIHYCNNGAMRARSSGKSGLAPRRSASFGRLLHGRLPPELRRALLARLAVRSPSLVYRGMLRARPHSVPGEDAPARALPGLASSAAPF